MLTPRNPIQNAGLIAQKVDNKQADMELNSVKFEYDVVIIGGGTAGCVLASRLSEDPDVNVLLIEAGGSSRNLLMSRMPAGFTFLFNTKHDHSIITEPQVNAGSTRKNWPRGKMLGGCSAMNAMIYHVGAPSDYDEWAATGLDGAEEWRYQSLQKYFLKLERFNTHPEYPDVDPSERGRDGPMNIGYFGHRTRITPKLIQACINLGIPHNPDVNSPSKGALGVTKLMTYIDKTGTRVTSESAYLTPAVLKRPNLKIVIYSTCTRIFFREIDDKKRAIGMEFAQRKGSISMTYRVKVKKELVIAAGAVGSPHILLLSGVGPRKQLEKHGITVVQDLPGVGRALQDHPIVTARFGLQPGYSLQHILRRGILDNIRTISDFFRWALSGVGPLASNSGETAAFVRCDHTGLFEADKYHIEDETSGPNAPDMELLMVPFGFVNCALDPPIYDSSMTLSATALRPQSRGTVELKSTNPFDPPHVNPRYLEKSNDLAVLVRGLKLLLKVVKTEPLASALRKVDNPLLDHELDKASDQMLEDEVRKRIDTTFHPTSTCRMARLEDEGVVDAQLKVYGLENVRIADASIFPRIPAGHPSAPVLAVAEKAADIIKSSLT